AHARGDGLDDVIGALRQLEVHRRVYLDAVEVGDPDVVHLMLAEGHDVVLAAGPREAVAADAPDAREYLARHQEGQQIGQRIREKSILYLHQIVLMAAERMPAEMVYAVVVEADDIIEM